MNQLISSKIKKREDLTSHEPLFDAVTQTLRNLAYPYNFMVSPSFASFSHLPSFSFYLEANCYIIANRINIFLLHDCCRCKNTEYIYIYNIILNIYSTNFLHYCIKEVSILTDSKNLIT